VLNSLATKVTKKASLDLAGIDLLTVYAELAFLKPIFAKSWPNLKTLRIGLPYHMKTKCIYLHSCTGFPQQYVYNLNGYKRPPHLHATPTVVPGPANPTRVPPLLNLLRAAHLLEKPTPFSPACHTQGLALPPCLHWQPLLASAAAASVAAASVAAASAAAASVAAASVAAQQQR